MSSETTTLERSESAERGYSLEILLVSFAGLLLEIAYTRVISFKLFYYYTYLVIGLALLGIGTGGVIVAMSKRIRRASTAAVLAWSSLIGAVSVGLGYVVIAWTNVDTRAIWDYGTRASFSNLARLVFVCLALFVSFIAIGVVVATLFGRRSERIGRLYFADLIGAGLACAIVVVLLGWIGPPATIMLAGVTLAGVGVKVALHHRKALAVVGVGVAALMFVGVVAPSVLPEQREDAIKEDLSKADVRFSSWSPLFRVDVVDTGVGVRFLYHDGLLGSTIYEYDGDPTSLTRFDEDPRKFPFDVLGKEPRRVLIIGAAGGNEILTSLYFDAHHVDAIELNPVTYDLVTDDFAEYDGHIADDPRVNYVKGDGRSYLARSDDTYDLVWYPAPDSYSATNAATSGAFVLSESYLYTSDAIEDSLEHLDRDGVLAAQFGEFDFAKKPNRTSRYIATARHALEQLGVHDPTRHIVVATSAAGVGGSSSLSTILVKRTPFTDAQIQRFVGAIGDVPDGALQYADGEDDAGGAVSRLMKTPTDRLDDFYDSYPYDVSPITDDGPFFWHFTPYGDVVSNFSDPIDRRDFEDAVGERVLLLLLVVALVMGGVFLLLPFIAIRKIWAGFPHKPRSALYFISIGLGFIFFEITLIQRLTLFLGYPTYSLTVTLASMLIFTGVGALLSGRIGTPSTRTLLMMLGTIAVLTLFYELGLPPLTDGLLDLPLALRVPITFVVMAPLGLCLGMFMPLGLGTVAGITEYPREYVAWGWAVNGFASVAGAVLTTILAMSFGFGVVLVLAFVVYGVALFTLRGLLGKVGEQAAPPATVS